MRINTKVNITRVVVGVIVGVWGLYILFAVVVL